MKNSIRPSLGFSIVHDVLVIAHGKNPPTDADWDNLVSASVQIYHRTQNTRALATSDGGTPTTAQRHHFDRRVRDEIIAKYGPPRGRMAVLSDSGFTRAVVGASALLAENWFTRLLGTGSPPQLYRAFKPTELALAIAWLEVPPGHASAIERELARLRSEVR